VQPGGVIAAVLPASFLGGAYYQKLRGFLHETAPLARLRLIDQRAGVFASGVLQETCLAIFHKGAAPSGVRCTAQTVNGRVRTVNLGRTRLREDAPDLPWMLPRRRSDRALVRAAASCPTRLRDHGWKASTGPLVWNRHKSQIAAEETDDAVPILWAADVEAGRVRRSSARDHQRWIRLRDRDAFMPLRDASVLVQRTTAPEQRRRLVAAALTDDVLRREWGGAVVIENHVNVLRRETPASPLSPRLLTALLNTATLDRLYRCMTGTVAVSAYELEALPLPRADVLRGWRRLSESELAAAVAAAYA
jgi:adenine-specific DNA-methyltransferase